MVGVAVATMAVLAPLMNSEEEVVHMMRNSESLSKRMKKMIHLKTLQKWLDSVLYVNCTRKLPLTLSGKFSTRSFKLLKRLILTNLLK